MESDKQFVEGFLVGVGLGRGGRDRHKQFLKEVNRVVGRLCERIEGEWGKVIMLKNKKTGKLTPLHGKALANYLFPVLLNLISYGCPKKPKGVTNFRGFATDTKKALKIINSISRPKNVIAELVDAFRKQPQYLP